jgi:DNA-binding Xre family transcriptional regulator
MIRLKVKELAVAQGLSQRKLARMANIDIKNIQKIFRYPTSKIVTTETLDKLAKALHVDASELLESVDEEKALQ